MLRFVHGMFVHMHRTAAVAYCATLLFIMLAVCDPAIGQAEGRDYIVVCADAGAGGYQAFPDVCRMADGRLICAFYAGYQHVSSPTAKLPKGGRISYCTSSDEGRTWSPAAVLHDSPLDDRDPSLTQLPDGRLLAAFFMAGASGAPENGVWLTESADCARTWSPARQVVRGYAVSSPILLLSTGRLILPLYREGGTGTNGAVVLSDDSGKTWGGPINIDNSGKYLDAETSVIELADGRVYAAERAASDTPMHFAISSDHGTTWSRSQPLPFKGHCPYLHRAPSGIVVLGTRAVAPNYTALRYSLDDCKTWSDPVRCDGTGGAYPSIVTLRDGSLLAVYYEEGPGSRIRERRFNVNAKGIEFLKFGETR